jgi:hypothetical protein
VIERGLDIQRLVVYPFLENSDHVPEVEYAPVSSAQSAFSAPSSYWDFLNDPAINNAVTVPMTPPAPDTHQSLHISPTEGLYLPSALAGCPGRIASASENFTTPAYSSGLVAVDSDEKVRLTLAATTDEVPLLSGVRLFYPDHQSKSAPGPDPTVFEIDTVD